MLPTLLVEVAPSLVALVVGVVDLAGLVVVVVVAGAVCWPVEPDVLVDPLVVVPPADPDVVPEDCACAWSSSLYIESTAAW